MPLPSAQHSALSANLGHVTSNPVRGQRWPWRLRTPAELLCDHTRPRTGPRVGGLGAALGAPASSPPPCLARPVRGLTRWYLVSGSRFLPTLLSYLNPGARKIVSPNRQAPGAGGPQAPPKTQAAWSQEGPWGGAAGLPLRRRVGRGPGP